MSDTTTETADEMPGGFAGSMDDILDAIGLEPETPEEAAAMARGEDPGAARAAAAAKVDEDDAGDKVDAKPAKDAAGKKKDEPAAEKTEEAKQLEEWAAVRKRATERRQAARAAARGDAAPAARAAEVVDDKPADAAAAAPDKKPDAPAAKSEVQQAVADIVAALEGLESEDTTAAADAAAGKDATSKTIAAKAAREANLTAIKEKLGILAEAVDGSKKTRDEYAEAAKDLRARIKDIEDTAFVENIAETTIARMESKLPHLSKHRNASKLLIQAAGDFLERNKRAAPMAFVAEKVERVLARRAGETNGAASPSRGNGAPANGASGKQHPSRKTVSADLATPPSRRQGDDKRTPKQVEEDLWNALGLDPDA
jgi:archaellum component FlaC